MQLFSLILTAAGFIATLIAIPQMGSAAGRLASIVRTRRTPLNPHKSAMHALFGGVNLRQSRDFSVRAIENLAELADLWKIDVEAYGEANLDFTVLRDWWIHHKTGIYAIFSRDRIGGAIGIWPIPKKWITGVVQGKLSESHLTGKDLAGAKARKGNYWYIAGVVVRPEMRHTRAVPFLLKEAAFRWSLDHDFAYPVELYAIAVSPEGERMLTKYGFSLIVDGERTKDGYSFYHRQLDRNDVYTLASQHNQEKLAA